MKPTAILLSGGIDSAALAFWKRPQYAFTIDYGQASAQGEIRASVQISKELSIVHEVINVNCADLGVGDLALKPPARDAPASEWWPYRNQFLVTVAAMRAYSLGIGTLIFGSVKSDEFHADGRAQFFEAIDQLIGLQEGGMRIEAPAIGMTSTELVHTAGIPSAILLWSHSCHVSNISCGHCRGCQKHLQILDELGLRTPMAE